MAAPLNPSAIVPVVVTALIAWRMYYRIRRTIGRQTLAPARAWMLIVMFPLLLAIFVFTSRAIPENLLAMAAGVGIGAALGYYALRLTQFEQTPQGLFYTPHTHLSIAVSALLIIRIGYRLAQLYFSGVPASSPGSFTSGPLTLGLFGLVAGYYVAYSFGLLRWAHNLAPLAADVQPQQTEV